MNEFEVTLWSLHINISNWDLERFLLYDCLLFSALVSKHQLEIDERMNNTYYNNLLLKDLINDDPLLKEKYEEWNSEYPINPKFDAAQINHQFSSLRNVF